MSPTGATGRLTVFIFHRVLPQPDPLFPDEPDAKRFDQIISWIYSWFNVLPLDKAVSQLKDKTIPSRAACITFDDGYADNFTIALPILRKYNLSATFFVATGFLDGGRMWNDSIIESIRTCSTQTLDLTPLGLGKFSINNISEKKDAIASVISKIKYLPHPERSVITNQVVDLAQAQPPNDLMMTSDQVRLMSKAGMQIGAHTVSHPILARIDAHQARQEISENKIFLEQLLGEKVGLFAYPNGKPGTDYLSEHVSMVAELGFNAAVSTVKGCATTNCDFFQIPRFTPWDKGKLAFGGRTIHNLISS